MTRSPRQKQKTLVKAEQLGGKMVMPVTQAPGLTMADYLAARRHWDEGWGGVRAALNEGWTQERPAAPRFAIRSPIRPERARSETGVPYHPGSIRVEQDDQGGSGDWTRPSRRDGQLGRGGRQYQPRRR